MKTSHFLLATIAVVIASPPSFATTAAAHPAQAPTTPTSHTLYLGSVQDFKQGAPCVLWRADTKRSIDGICVKSIGQWAFTTGGVLYTFSAVGGGDEAAFMGPEIGPLAGWKVRQVFVDVTLSAAPEAALEGH